MDINLILKIIFRPLTISTEDFGKLWLSFANDVKQNVKIPEPQASLLSALKTLQQKLRLHVVDVRGWWCSAEAPLSEVLHPGCSLPWWDAVPASHASLTAQLPGRSVPQMSVHSRLY